MTDLDLLLARHIAADTVGRVLRSGAYSNVLLASATSTLSKVDAARTKALTYGVLRHLEPIDRSITQGAGRSIDDLDDEVADCLRVSSFEILYSETPAPVAVSVGVDLVRNRRPKAAGFANAVLRRVSELDPPPPSVELPDWLDNSLRGAWGEEEVNQFAEASTLGPARVVRSNVPVESGTPVPGIEGAYEIEPGPLPGGTSVQDAASIAVGNVVEAKPGMTVADLAAAPGGKTNHLFQQMGGDGLLIAVDRHPRRVRDSKKRVPAASWVIGDCRFPPLTAGRFDRVLLDAPCSGLGTMRRRPEVRIRNSSDDVARLAETQLVLVEAALELVAPGGKLVYSVCTVTPEETVGVVERYDFEPADTPGKQWGKGTLMAPHLTGTDGMFVAVFRG